MDTFLIIFLIGSLAFVIVINQLILKHRIFYKAVRGRFNQLLDLENYKDAYKTLDMAWMMKLISTDELNQIKAEIVQDDSLIASPEPQNHTGYRNNPG